MLTAAWLDARRSNFAGAVPVARAAMVRLPATSEALTLTVTRWSLARGPEGLPEARRAARRAAGGRRELPARRARGAGDGPRRATSPARRPSRRPWARPSPRPLAEPHPADRQDPAFPEQVNAVGVALLLAGRPAEAAPLLRRALEQTPPGWRGFQQRMLLRAGR